MIIHLCNSYSNTRVKDLQRYGKGDSQLQIQVF